jgi:hypothetical protein
MGNFKLRIIWEATMNKKITIAILFVFLAVSSASTQITSSIVTNNDYRLGLRYSECRNSARMLDGTIVVAWESHDAFDREIYYSTYDAGLGAWADKVQLSNPSEDTRGPALVADDDGMIYAEWEEKQGGVYSVMFSKFDGNTWTAPVVLDTFSTSIGMGNIGVSSDGGTIVVGYLTAWSESADIFAAVSVDGGTNWTTTNLTATDCTPGLLSQKYAIPSIAVTSSGSAYMLWYDVPDDGALPVWWAEVVMSTYDGTSWSAPEVVSLMEDGSDNAWDGRGVIALDPDESLHMVYASNDTSWGFLPGFKPKAIVLYRKCVGGVWSDPIRIDDSIEPSAWEPSIGIGSNGAIYTTYSQLDPAYPDVRNSYYVISGDGGATFSLPVKVSNNTYPSSENFPEISIGSVRNEIGGVFCGGADMTWIEYDTLTVNDFNVMHGVIPLAIVTGIFYPDLISDVMPEEYHLSQNYPNPFNPTTTIKFRLPKNEHVSLVIYNIMGRRIRTLIDEEKKADNYTVTWDGCDFYGTRVATGIYFYQLLANDAVITKKMLLMK